MDQRVATALPRVSMPSVRLGGQLLELVEFQVEHGELLELDEELVGDGAAEGEQLVVVGHKFQAVAAKLVGVVAL